MKQILEKAIHLQKALKFLDVLIGNKDAVKIVLSYDTIMEKQKDFSLQDVEEVNEQVKKLAKKNSEEKDLQEP